MESPAFGPDPKRFIFSVEIELLRKPGDGFPWRLPSCGRAASPMLAPCRRLAHGPWPQDNHGALLAMMEPAPPLWRLGEMPADLVPKRAMEWRCEWPPLSGVTKPAASPLQGAPGHSESAGVASERKAERAAKERVPSPSLQAPRSLRPASHTALARLVSGSRAPRHQHQP